MRKRYLITLLVLSIPLAGCQIRLAPQLDPFYTAVLREFPTHEAALFGQGNYLVRQGRYREAVRYFRKLVSHFPRHEGGWISLGQCELELNRFRRAEAAFRQAEKLKRSLESQIGLANSLIFQGRIDEAKEVAVAIEQQMGPSAILYRLLGDIAFVEKNPRRAVDYYQKSLVSSPSQEDLRDRIADIEQHLTFK